MKVWHAYTLSESITFHQGFCCFLYLKPIFKPWSPWDLRPQLGGNTKTTPRRTSPLAIQHNYGQPPFFVAKSQLFMGNHHCFRGKSSNKLGHRTTRWMFPPRWIWGSGLLQENQVQTPGFQTMEHILRLNIQAYTSELELWTVEFIWWFPES